MSIWVPLIGDELLTCQEEKGYVYGSHAVAFIRGNFDIRYAPKNICGFFWKFLFLSNTSIWARVLGKSVNRGAGYGLEIPVCFVFQSHLKEND